MNSYNKNDIAQLAAQTNFLRDNLEKVLRLSDVLQFTEAEIAFIDAFLSKKHQPEVLFSDQTIIDNIRNHPMAFWKTKE